MSDYEIVAIFFSAMTFMIAAPAFLAGLVEKNE